MGNFRVEATSREHIVQRICERLLRQGRGKAGMGACCADDATQVEAARLLDDAVNALRQQTPVDWRFTQHPSACFFVSLVCDCSVPGETPRTCPDHVKLLGVTVRESEDGRKLLAVVEEYVEQALVASSDGVGHREAWAAANWKALRGMAELYLKDLARADSEIVHELRTAYGPAEDIAQRRASNEAVLAAHSHTMILRHLKVTSTRASMPNALLCAEPTAGGPLRLWVRQGPRWSRATKDDHQAPMYALFCPLQPEGPRFEEGRIWSFNSQGLLRCLGAADVPRAGCVRWHKPDGYHTESYWSLPTRLDVLRMDMDYLQREQAHAMTAREAMLRHVVDQAQALALTSLKLADEPAWSRKARKCRDD
jgi:hypothetical protein